MATYALLPMEDIKDAAAAVFAKVAHLPVQPAWISLYAEDADSVYRVEVTPAYEATAFICEDYTVLAGRQEVSFR